MLLTDLPALETLRNSLYGDLFTPADDGWDEARAAWNLAADQRPAAVAFPLTDSDVVAVVNFARENDLRVAPQGTGHGAASLESLEDAILLSTRHMRGVRIDPRARRARVRAGALWEDVTSRASLYGLAPLAGSSPDVAVVGYTLGGGLSWLGRKYGLAAHAITAIDVVTGDGVHRHVTDGDLFWALRGGGGSFGVVTAIEFELFAIDELHGGALLWPVERAQEIFAAWRAWTDTVPDEVTSLCRVLNVPDMPDAPPPLRGKSFVVVEAAILGGDAILAPLRALEPMMDMVGPIEPAALIRIHNDPEQPMPSMGGHRLLADIDEQGIAALVANADAPLIAAELRHLDGALGRPGNAALSKLDGRFSLFAVGIASDACHAALERLTRALAPWDAGSAYLNFAETPEAAGRFFDPTTLARLNEMADDLFVANHPVTGSAA